ncbi:MAG: hypothetical protein GQ538_01120 [Xanthomonadales bacterium]|nr:hypothetical protein [Xanthomonadales bacterium]
MLILIFMLAVSSHIHAQVLTNWVETRSAPDADEIALGYPVPIPVNTPLPFDGFRTYAGLHVRHQELAATTPWVHPEAIGTTRAGRTIWAYRLGDKDLLTIDGFPEAATLTNGGIHAREWQSPEVVTGILELLALHESDQHFYDYLRDNVNMIVIPALNIDGFMQTQRYPALNYMQSDPNDPDFSPRDGRMRRKNMLATDEDLFTTPDHLNGVDLNRNNAPYWATQADRSSPNLNSIVHHGAAPASEPEIQALDAAAQLGPIGRLRIYTDVHSFSMVHFWGRNFNARLAIQTENVLKTFSDHHVSFPAGKYYAFTNRGNAPQNIGIGTTDEYFTTTYQVPSWTLEVEPSNGQAFHAPLAGGGADYGGVHENGHDGFILPEAEIRRVREQLAQSFAAVYYRQAGPPIIRAARILDKDTGAVIYHAEWDTVDEQTRSLYSKQLQALQIGPSYILWLSFNKPMRWREEGLVVAFPGQPGNALDVDASLLVNDSALSTSIGDANWLNQPGGTPDGYMTYQDDALRVTFSLDDDTQNRSLIVDQAEATLKLRTKDMTGMFTDTRPATVADWKLGAWSQYENDAGDESDTGGYDTNLAFQVSGEDLAPPFVLEAGITASWYDPARSGEGYVIQILEDNVAVMYWFTYDTEGAQNWYVASGEISGNRIVFPELYQVTGGEFGPGFDPEKVDREIVGSASFIWSGCDKGEISYRVGSQHEHLQLSRLTSLMGIDCGKSPLPAASEEALLSGSWYDPSHSGEGYIVEVLEDGRVVVFWFSFDPEGKPRWFFDEGENRAGTLVFDDMLTASGGIFGPEFDPDTVEFKGWGALELDLGCETGTASYNSSEDGFGAGTLNLVRLTRIDQLDCRQ